METENIINLNRLGRIIVITIKSDDTEVVNGINQNQPSTGEFKEIPHEAQKIFHAENSCEFYQTLFILK